jgi:hypothetical protein
LGCSFIGLERSAFLVKKLSDFVLDVEIEPKWRLAEYIVRLASLLRGKRVEGPVCKERVLFL